MARIKNMKTIDLKIAENEENLWKLAVMCDIDSYHTKRLNFT